MAKRVITYKPVIPIDHPNKERAQQFGLDKEFQALSIGHKNGQIALIPLDESNIKNGRKIVDLWNSESKEGLYDKLNKVIQDRDNEIEGLEKNRLEIIEIARETDKKYERERVKGHVMAVLLVAGLTCVVIYNYAY